MLENVRSALRQATAPGTVALALLVALAETAAALLAGTLAGDVHNLVPSGRHLFFAPFAATTLVSLVVWLPVAAFALAGFYGALGEAPRTVSGSLRTFVRVGRAQYRRYLTASVASAALGAALLVAVWLVLVAGFLAASTAFDYLRYASGARFAANPMWSVVVTAGLLAVAGLAASAAFAFAGPLVVRTDVEPRRAPLASLQFLRAQPRRVLPAAVLAAVGYSVPTVLGRQVFRAGRPARGSRVVTPAQHESGLFVAAGTAVAVTVVAALLAHLLVGPLLVRVTDRYADPAETPSLRAITLDRRTVAVAVAVLLVGTSAVAVRVADVRPHNPAEPGIDLEQAPGDVYEASVDLTTRSARRANLTVVTRHPNGTRTEGISFVTAWDPADRQATVTMKRVHEQSPAAIYLSERVQALREPGTIGRPARRGAVRRTVNGWLVVSAPTYAAMDKPGEFGSTRDYVRDDTSLRVVERTPERLVLGTNGTGAARLSDYQDREGYGFENATFRAAVDPDTGYLQRVRLTGVRVEYDDEGAVAERRHRTDTITYTGVGSTDVDRPAIGDPSPLELLWDAFVY